MLAEKLKHLFTKSSAVRLNPRAYNRSIAESGIKLQPSEPPSCTLFTWLSFFLLWGMRRKFKKREKLKHRIKKVFYSVFFQTRRRKKFGNRWNRLQVQVQQKFYKCLKCSKAPERPANSVLGLCMQCPYALQCKSSYLSFDQFKRY